MVMAGDQDILRILQRHFRWKTSSCLMSADVTLNISVPQRRKEVMQLWRISQVGVLAKHLCPLDRIEIGICLAIESLCDVFL